MIEHDGTLGSPLKKLDDLEIASDTIVIYATDNGRHMSSWPDGAMTRFRREKNTNWEGAFRVPAMIRWRGHIAPGPGRLVLPRDRALRRSSPDGPVSAR